MDDMNQQPFERQVKDVANRAVGPERHVEALAIARYAREQSRRSRLGPLFGGLRYAMGAAVVLLFGAALLMSGILDGGEESTSPAASPSASPDASVERGPDEVLYAGGSFVDAAFDVLAMGEGPWSYELRPRYFTVVSTDSRLTGEAILLQVREERTHVLTTRDLEEIRPSGALEAVVGRLEIRNADGAWEGTLGPSMRASGGWEQPTAGEGSDLRDAPALSDRATGVLEGQGAYAGLSAYIGFIDDDDILLAPSQNGRVREFEAVIVNAPPLRPPSSGAFDDAREWIESTLEDEATE